MLKRRNKMIDIDKLTVEELCKQENIQQICDCKVVCDDSSEYPRRDYTVTIDGIDSKGKGKRYFLRLTEWEELSPELEK